LDILKKNKTILALDGVRAIACLNVITYHVHYIMQHAYGFGTPFGMFGSAVITNDWSGVTLFFVLSGFLLFMPFVQAMLDMGKWPSLRTFYLRRALRILPAYYLSLFLLIILQHPEYLRPDHLRQLGLFLTFLMDAPFTYQQINGPFWTLAVEWQYYMLLPLLALAFSWIVKLGTTQHHRFKLLIYCLVAMVLWGIGTRYIGNYYTLHPHETLLVPRDTLNWILLVIYGSSGKYFEDFAIGMLICTIYIYVQNNKAYQQMGFHMQNASFWLWASGILLLFFMSAWNIFPALYPFLVFSIGAHAWLCELGYAVGYGLCITAILYGGRGLKSLFEGGAIRFIGRISYSLYIWHIPIILFFTSNFLVNLPHNFPMVYIAYWLCVLLMVLPFSYLFYRFVELPGMRLAHKNREYTLQKKRTYMDASVTDIEVISVQSHPTVYADVNIVLHEFLTKVQTILGDTFYGMYLSGSLALGDFSSQRSDIDFVVVTNTSLSNDLLSALQSMHAHFNASASPWATEIEAAYIPLDALHHYDPAHACHPHIERGKYEILHMDELNTGWIIQYYILREHGVVIAGPQPLTLIDPISAQDIQQAVITLMDEWWSLMRHDSARLQYRGYQVYAVLTMCRMLYTLDCGAVVSKPCAARWVQKTSNGRWDALIDDALVWQKDRTWGEEGHDVSAERVDETQALIQYTFERCQQWQTIDN